MSSMVQANLPKYRTRVLRGGNPFHHHQDLNRLRVAWQKPRTIIVHEPCGPALLGMQISFSCHYSVRA